MGQPPTIPDALTGASPVSIHRKLLFNLALFALTGGLIAITLKVCFRAGWDTSPMALGFYRMLVIGIVYLLLAVNRQDRLLPASVRARAYLLAATVLKAIVNALLLYGLLIMDAAVFQILFSCLYPAFSLMITRYANRLSDRLTAGRVSGCLLGAGAAVMIGLKDGFDFSTNIGLWGFCIAGLACLVAGIHLNLERKAIEHGATPMQSMLGVSLYTAPLFLVFAVVAGEPLAAPLASGSGLSALLFCVLIGVLHYAARRYCQGISQVSGFLLIELLVVFVTVVTAVLFLGEILTWPAVVGLACLPVALWIGRARLKVETP